MLFPKAQKPVKSVSVVIKYLLIALLVFLGVALAPSTGFCASDCDTAKVIFSDAHYKIQNEKKRVPHFAKAIDLCPGYIRPYEVLGNWYRKNGQPGQAIELFGKAAELGSNNNKLYYHLAALLLKQNQVDEAWQNINKSLEIRSNYSRAKKLKKRIENASDTDGPQIVLYEPSLKGEDDVIEKYEQVSIRGTSFDKSGIAALKINGLEITLEEGGVFSKSISLESTETKIEIESTDTRGNAATIVFRVKKKKPEVTYTVAETDQVQDIKTLYRKSYAVVIGIDQYRQWPSLEFAVADADAIGDVLTRSGFDEIITIRDAEATQRKILSVLYHELPAKVTENDRLMFYFAGHGHTHQSPSGSKRGYIVPVDCGLDDYEKAAISMKQIRSLTNRISARHILYVMDSCYSGLGFSRSAGVSPNMSNYLKKVAGMRVVQMITAGGSGEQVMELDGHGLFTSFLLKALGGKADINQDRYVTGTELGAYLRPKVSDASNNAQTPLFGRFEGEGEFLFPVAP